jgi:hypothetical protein
MSGCVSSKGKHVQQETNLPGQKVRHPVVRIAGWRETKTLKPIDEVSLRGDYEASGRNESESAGRPARSRWCKILWGQAARVWHHRRCNRTDGVPHATIE